MKLADLRENYNYFSCSVSNVVRQISLGGIAVIWMFAVNGNNGEYFLDGNLFFPLGLFVCALAFDLFQYAYGAAIWGWLHRTYEVKGIEEGEDIPICPKVNWPTITFFWSKIAIAIVAAVSLMIQLISLVLDASLK